MLTPLRIIFFYIAAVPFLVAVLIFFSVDDYPEVRETWSLSHQDIARAKEILRNNNSHHSGLKTLTLTEKDLNIALNYLLNSYVLSATQIKLQPTGLDFVITLNLPNNLFGRYVNIRFDLSKQNDFPIITRLAIGKIDIADEFASLIIKNIIKHTQLKQYYVLFSRHIQQIKVDAKQLLITYQLTPEDYRRARKLLTFGTDNNALIYYQEKLNELINNHDPDRRLSLADLLKPLFHLAFQRSTMDNAIEENRSVIFIVNAYLNRHEIQNFLPAQLTASKPVPVFLYQRVDMAKHFMGSAALTASGSGYIAHTLGLEKELRDSQKGSGFSFVDLAADRAGMQFGEMATSSPESARIMQKAMSEINHYRDFMPEVRDLPENMDDYQFQEKFGSIYSQRYQKVLEKIDSRIAACIIYAEQ